MPVRVTNTKAINGLNTSAIPELQLRFGKNAPLKNKNRRFLHFLIDVVKEPMVILLSVACLLYFLLQKTDEGLMMIAAMAFVIGISVYQDVRSFNALETLREYTEEKVKVVRDGSEHLLSAVELVPGDVVLLEEGNKIPADGLVIRQNDFTVSESIITGEAFPVDKTIEEGKNVLYQGTVVNSGSAHARVTAIGGETLLQKLGKSIAEYASSRTLLQEQVGRFVKRFTLFGIAAFLLICFINYFKTGDLISSILLGLTLAMAAIPEEIPVAFSSFMALGAWRMSKLGIITRQPQTIENLGAVSVICLDKTGTITKNKMKVHAIYDFIADKYVELENDASTRNNGVLYYAMLASEINPFDSMEKAILDAYLIQTKKDGRPELIYEYPLSGQPPMMTHVYKSNQETLVAAKGAAERIIQICKLDKHDSYKVNDYLTKMASGGYRLLGVASAQRDSENLPISQNDFDWKLEGLLSLYDPPKENVGAVLKRLYEAGIKIKLLTGDYTETAINVANQVGIANSSAYATGEDVLLMNEAELKNTIRAVNVFTRMFPEAKTRVIKALKDDGDIVAMTGDGVNDGPALKAADIGIAMGLKGTEIARQAADLILTDDNMEKILGALQQGRKILNNLKKAIRYIISIHIPIICTAILPLVFGWKYPTVFSPIHIIFLELIMGPTCSVFFEREPVEPHLMLQPPRKRSASLFSQYELFISIGQGLLIALGILALYYYYMQHYSQKETRTIVFTTLILSNIFLTFVNRSFSESFVKTIRYKNNLAWVVFIISLGFLVLIHTVPLVRNLFELSTLTFKDLSLCLLVAFLSTAWLEFYKLFRTFSGKSVHNKKLQNYFFR